MKHYNDVLADQLQQARDLLSTSWCEIAEAVTKTGKLCRPNSRHAVRWCAIGVLAKLDVQIEAVEALRSTAHKVYPYDPDAGQPVIRGKESFSNCVPITSVNDLLGKEAILKVFDITIADLRKVDQGKRRKGK